MPSTRPRPGIVERRLVLEVDFGPPLVDLVERRLGDEEVPALDDLGHLPVEEGQQQGADVRAVDVGVGHDHDLVIAQLRDVELVAADAGAHRLDEGADLLRREHLVEARALDVQDLAAQRQDGLVVAVAALLGRAAGASRPRPGTARTWPGRAPGSRRACRAARRRSSALLRLRLARLARPLARRGGVDDLLDDDARFGRGSPRATRPGSRPPRFRAAGAPRS